MEWDDFYIGMAQYVSRKSKDVSTRVGCVLVDQKNRVISLGFNGAPRGVSDEHSTRDAKIAKTIHAEVNAVLFAPRELAGATAYVTHPCCSACAAVLIQKEVCRVVFPTPTDDFISRWGASYQEALTMFMEAGVKVYEMKVQPD